MFITSTLVLHQLFTRRRALSNGYITVLLMSIRENFLRYPQDRDSSRNLPFEQLGPGLYCGIFGR